MKDILRKIRTKKVNVLVIGLGYVGFPLLELAIKKKINCYGLDINKELIKKIEKKLEKRNFFQKILFYDYEKVNFFKIDIIIIALPTPLKNKKPDLSFIKNCVNKFFLKIKKNTIIILESTSYPSTTEEIIVKRLIKKYDIGTNLFIGYSPERVDPGNKEYNIENTPKLVSGYTLNCRNLIYEFYKKLCNQVLIASSIQVAEMTKIYENIFRSVNIGLANETKILCEKIKINFREVINLASSKPFGFIPFYPGPGVGGHCIPVDPTYLSWYATKKNLKTDFIKIAAKINSGMPKKIANKICNILKKNNISKMNKILILGLSYKKNIQDIRNSPALEIFSILNKKKFNISFNDKFVKEIIVNKKKYYSEDLNNLKKFKSIIMLTDHDYYKKINFIKYKPTLIDTRFFFSNTEKVYSL